MITQLLFMLTPLWRLGPFRDNALFLEHHSSCLGKGGNLSASLCCMQSRKIQLAWLSSSPNHPLFKFSPSLTALDSIKPGFKVPQNCPWLCNRIPLSLAIVSLGLLLHRSNSACHLSLMKSWNFLVC